MQKEQIKTIRIFLASSNELKHEREQFEIQLYRKCKDWFAHRNIFLHLDIWEDLSARMSPTHSQDEYNKYVKASAITVVLAYTKVGEYTLSEFETAKRTFDSTQKPFIFVYFKANPPFTGNNIKDLESLSNFQDMLKKAGYFFPSFDSFDNLWNRFNKELDRLAEGDFKEWKNEDNSQEKPIQQVFQNISGGQIHTGTGDNIGGDVIKRQINVKGDYHENKNS